MTEGGRGRLGTNKKQQVERQKKNLAVCSSFPNQITSVCRQVPRKRFLPLLFNLKTQLSRHKTFIIKIKEADEMGKKKMSFLNHSETVSA